MIPWQAITSLGDVVVTVPAAIAIAVWLIANGERRLTLRWCVLFGVGMALVVASKLAFIGWGIGSRSLDFTGFSGHAMRAAAVIPVLLHLVLQRASPAARRSGVLLGILFGVVIAISRVIVHAHSVSEVVTGWGIGMAIGLGFMANQRTALKLVPNPMVIALGLAAALVTSHAEPTPTQRWITRLALYLSGHERPFVRDGWRFADPAGTVGETDR